MALNYRRGSAAITEAATRKSGDFRPFLPQISWRNDGESKFVLVLTDIAEVAELLLHSFIPIGKGKKSNGDEFTRYDDFLSRRDPAIGEDYDDLEDRLEREPKLRCMGVMVELEPVLEGGSKKLNRFVVKTETFTRKTDDGDVEVIAPVIGLCTQSAVTLWGSVNSLAESLGDLIDTPVQITRRGEKTSTRYDLIPFQEKPVDLSPVIDYVDGINYIGDDLDTVIKRIDAEESEAGKAQAVADYLMVKRIHELADAERYEELVGPLTMDDMPKNQWGRKAPSKNGARTGRPARRSPRERVPEDAEAPAEAVSAPEEAPAKVDRFQALKDRVENRA